MPCARCARNRTGATLPRARYGTAGRPGRRRTGRCDHAGSGRVPAGSRRNHRRVYFLPHLIVFGRLPIKTIDGVDGETLPLNGILEHVVENATPPRVVARRSGRVVQLSSARAEGQRDALEFGEVGERHRCLTNPIESGGHLGGAVDLPPILVVLPSAKCAWWRWRSPGPWC